MNHHRRLPDDGSTSVQYAIVSGLFLLLFFAAVQTGLWWYARSVCLTAAWHGVQAGRTVDGTTTEALITARSFLSRVGLGLVEDTAVTASSDANNVRVQVSGTAIRILPLPFGNLDVTQSATGAKERYTTPGGAR
ncbi:TadE/TadG family type IV pilus assembly protein [Kibdelosporangium lantanae]|uniref:TadE/TadG family type IV pilus assembly protein n=1 Tax=Kibdelosporangium lantanae TaxID=1497396 RepID=A0ABW3M8E7_9PSEU